MEVQGVAYRSIWAIEEGKRVGIIDQTRLPHEFVEVELTAMNDAAIAIRDMWVRGAPLIGATAAYGMALAMSEDTSNDSLDHAYETLYATRPTAVNLRWALDDMKMLLQPAMQEDRVAIAWQRAREICDEDAEANRQLGAHGLRLIEEIAAKKPAGEPVNILTHCNAGWLATVDWGTATSAIYQAHNKGIKVHVWVDETRPRNQGAHLTAWELGEHGVPHTLIVDNVGGHLMQHGLVDLCIVGTDRTTASGDVCNKIGTYLKALAAHDNGVPFYVALPSSTIDWTIHDGIKEIPIEQRCGDEVAFITGQNAAGVVENVRICPQSTPVANYAFDVTPAKYVNGLMTERGVCAASAEGLASLFPERVMVPQP
ncbi:S-methyl-5-thioribose-1-phosphate isomerase [Rhodobacteraceae bacterium RKSG542]|uniref:S-methyl-5-thioribose-1-phosphate isomerase n=1 Tax=Pseudovibrio flavus TaxID=2529854 RepID=UPI0012BBB45B|nr:S-methyl-5-thioribose-1-phosphate isomerase [Pseudovibrio flavus]MTI18548.1 S-methyl-5-thioribose-1-phosphate isomerase [Pseudovibrio flavus]